MHVDPELAAKVQSKVRKNGGTLPLDFLEGVEEQHAAFALVTSGELVFNEERHVFQSPLLG